MKKRITWEQYFMNIAKTASEMGTCDRLKVGCILVKEKRIIATGFNGSISGLPHCDEVGHLLSSDGRCIRTVHAEQNALLQCAKHGISTLDSIAYVTHEPCEHCIKFLAQAGVKKVYFLHPYPNLNSQHFKSSLVLIKIQENNV